MKTDIQIVYERLKYLIDERDTSTEYGIGYTDCLSELYNYIGKNILENKPSQSITELCDEEIFEGVNKMPFNFDQEECFIMGCQWYREQLKKKQ